MSTAVQRRAQAILDEIRVEVEKLEMEPSDSYPSPPMTESEFAVIVGALVRRIAVLELAVGIGASVGGDALADFATEGSAKGGGDQ